MWERTQPIRGRWRRIEPRVVSHVRSAPGTYVYLFVLLITTWVLATSSGPVARRLLQERSTNLYHLSRDPVRVLVASAFWLSSPWQLLLWLVLFTALVAPVEQRLGTGRTAAAFFAGHVGATLLIAAGLWGAVRADLVESSVAHARDVGASYGFFAVAALFGRLLRGRMRIVYLCGLAGAAAIDLGASPGFTGVGHLLALAIGVSCYRLVPKAASAEPLSEARAEGAPRSRRIPGEPRGGPSPSCPRRPGAPASS